MTIKIDDIKIRTGLESDLDSIYDIEKLDVDAWSYGILKQDLLENEFSKYLVAEYNDELVGFLSIMNIYGEIHINNILVKEEYRNLSIGDKLLKYGLNFYEKDDIIGYTLEVREDNISAIKLYKKNGFTSVGMRKNYYNNNKNAIIMWKMLEEKKC